MFNQYIWNNYLEAGGKKVAQMFEKNLTEEFTEEYIDQIAELHKCYCPSKDISNDIKEALHHLRNDLLVPPETNEDEFKLLDFFVIDNKVLESQEIYEKTVLDFLYNVYENEIQINAQEIYSFAVADNIEYMSTVLAIQIPELFVPYYYKCNFNVLEKICTEFEIELPKIPVKKDYKGRFYYYGELCKSFNVFREKQNLSLYEFCAFLYDFAPKAIGGIDSYILKELPEPEGAYFIGAPGNCDNMKDDNNFIGRWQCNPETKPGDMIVMYLRTPISSVDSVWRSVSYGFNDPFFYYYRCTYIAKPIGINRVTKKQLEQDILFGNLPIVRKNMQGVNGVELKPSEYNHLMEIAKASKLKLKYYVSEGNIELLSEKDVENKLIKPKLLERLGYKEKDYVQQFHIDIGNHNKMIIPDFLVLPDNTKGHQRAFAVVEAKFNIPNSAFLEETKIQARSYSRQVLAKYCVIASKDKIWVSTLDDDFTEDIFIASWDELNNPDVFSELNRLLGCRIKR